jgi:hypothetical protein
LFANEGLGAVQISTAQFGQQWVRVRQFCLVGEFLPRLICSTSSWKFCAECWFFYKVEAIGSTNEGICAGTIDGGSHVALIHAGFPLGTGGTKIDATVV